MSSSRSCRPSFARRNLYRHVCLKSSFVQLRCPWEKMPNIKSISQFNGANLRAICIMISCSNYLL